MTRPAIIYARFSSLEQAKGYSLERQVEYGRSYAAAQKFTLEAVITDEGRSAFHGANRAVGSSLFQFEAEAREGLHRGKTLVVENIDRLSRQGAKAAAQLVWALNENGVDVATWHDDSVYRADESGDVMELFSIIIKAQMAHESSLEKSRRTSASWQKRYADIAKGKAGILVGQTPAWIVEQDGRYVLHPRREAVLNEIFDLYIAGTGIYRIVQILNTRDEAVWTTNKRNKGGGWYLPYVHRLLTNRAVLGEYRTLKGELISTDYWPQAVSATKFNQANEQRSTRVTTGGGNQQRINNLLSGLVRCSCCQGTAGYENKGTNSVTTYRAKNGDVRRYARKRYERFRCDANRRKRACENSALFDYGIVETAVLDRVLSLAVDDDVDRRDGALVQELAEAQRRISARRGQLENLVDALADGGSKAIVSRIALLEQEIEADEVELQSLQARADIQSVQPSHTDDVALVAGLRDELTSEDTDVRFYARTRVNKALKRVLDRVWINKDNTFTVHGDAAVWHFDGAGELLGGQAL